MEIGVGLITSIVAALFGVLGVQELLKAKNRTWTERLEEFLPNLATLATLFLGGPLRRHRGGSADPLCVTEGGCELSSRIVV